MVWNSTTKTWRNCCEQLLTVARHPTIEFHSTGLTELGADNGVLDGQLTLNGVTRPVRLELTYLGIGRRRRERR